LDWKAVIEKLKKSENVKEVSATTYESAVIVGTQATSYAVLRVIEGRGSREFLLPTLDPHPSSLVPVEISLGKELAEKTNLKIGDEAGIITLENEFAPTTSKVFIKEIFQTGLYEYDSTWIYISPEDFSRLKAQKNFTPTILSVSVKDIYTADKTADEIRANLGDNFKVVDWQEANRPLFAALSLERRVALAIVSLIIFIAALNITTTLALLGAERRFDIAILRTCGAQTKSLIFIFLLEGLLLGFTGIFFGVSLGLLGCFLGNYFKIIRLSAEVYSLNYIPFHPDLNNILLIILIAFLVCLAATVYPALKIGKIKPLENLRRQ
nr:ABC transporter permease [Acidobacteriota bacterium]